MIEKLLDRLFSLKTLRIILTSVLGIIIIIILITGGNILLFRGIFNWITGHIQSITGCDLQIAKAMAALLTGLALIMPLGKLLWAASPIPMRNKAPSENNEPKKRKRFYKSKGFYRLTFFVGLAIFFLFTYFGGKNVNFDQKGEPLKFVGVRPNGEYYIVSDSGYDPLTGMKLIPITTEISLEIKGLSPPVKPKAKDEYFDPKTGEPLKFYSLRPNGAYYIVSDSGYDPKTGDKLKAVTREISLKMNGLLPKVESVAPEPVLNTQGTQKSKDWSAVPETPKKQHSDFTPKPKKKVINEQASPAGKSSYVAEPNEYILPEQVNPTSGWSDNYQSTERKVDNSYDPRGQIHFSNETGRTVIVFNSAGRERFRVFAHRSGIAKMSPGDYFYVVLDSQGAQIRFSVKEQENSEIKFKEQEINQNYPNFKKSNYRPPVNRRPSSGRRTFAF